MREKGDTLLPAEEQAAGESQAEPSGDGGSPAASGTRNAKPASDRGRRRETPRKRVPQRAPKTRAGIVLHGRDGHGRPVLEYVGKPAQKEWQSGFLSALGATGSVPKAAEMAGIQTPHLIFKERKENPAFAKACDEAMRDAALAVAEPALLARGLEKSDTALLGFLNARLPDVYKGGARMSATQTKVAAGGIVIELTTVEAEN